MAILNDIPEPILPAGYVELEYIEQPLGNSGYFKSGLIPSNTLDFEVGGVTYDNIATTNYGCVFGSRTSATYEYQLNTFIESGATNKGTLRIGTAVNDAQLVKNQRYDITLSGTTLVCNGIKTTVTRDFNDASPAEIYIWAFNVADGGTPRVRQNGHGKLYYLRFKNNGTYVRYYIPCKHIHTGVAGLYDIVNEAFHPSEATAFVAGPIKIKRPLTTGISQQLIDLQIIKEDLRDAINGHYSSDVLDYYDGLVDYADAIDGITGSQRVLPTEPSVVNFIDYDGTLLYAYTAAEFRALDGMPPDPFHSGLIAQGWNWTREEILDYLNRAPRIDISQSYITSDGSTRLYINKVGQYGQTIQIYQSDAYGVEVDWGDGTTSDAQSGTGAKTFSHTYSVDGSYVIRLISKSGTFDFGNNPTGTSDSQNGVFGNPQSNETLLRQLYKVELGTGLVRLSSCAFYHAYNLKTISIPKKVQTFRHRCFQACYNLMHIAFPDGITLMAYCCNSGVSLKYLCFPPHMTLSSATDAFRYEYGVEYILVPDSVTGELSTGMFYSCHNLKHAYLSNRLTRLDNNCFRDCYSLRSINIPSTVTAVGTSNTYTDFSYAFGSCWSLASLVIPEGVTMIHAYFNQEGYGLYFLTLPSTLTIMGVNTFKTYATKYIIIKATTPPTIQSSSFYDNSSFTLYVPYSADHSVLANYQAASVWSTYASRMVELDENGNIPQ